MKQYKGYYIDKVIFNNEKEIDEFLEKQALEAYITACKIFNSHCTIESSISCDEKAQILVNNFGYTWEQIEQLEIQAYTA